MRIDQLQYLISVYETGSFSLAAKKEYITQPTISQAINNLELELGVKIFHRTRQGAKLTSDGEIVIKKAIVILTNFGELMEELELRSSSITGTLKLAIVPSICSTILPKTLEIYKNKYPLVDIEVFEKGSFEITNDILTGNADIGIIGFQDAQNVHHNLVTENLLSTSIKVCVGKRFELNELSEIALEEIVQHPIVMFKSGYNMNHMVHNLLSDYGEPNVLFSSGNTEVAKKVIADGIGIGFFTDLSLRDDPYVLNGSIIPLDIQGYNVESNYASIQPKNKHISLAGEEFIKELKLQAKCYREQE